MPTPAPIALIAVRIAQMPRDRARVELERYLTAPAGLEADSEEKREALDFAARLVTRLRELHEIAGRRPPWS